MKNIFFCATNSCIFLLAPLTCLFADLDPDELLEKQLNLRADPKIGWEQIFKIPENIKPGEEFLPDKWLIKKKPGTPPSKFNVMSDENHKNTFLNMKSEKASASLLKNIGNFNIRKYPILEWRWKIKKLPENADGRNPEKDDQAIGIYVGTGTILDKKSVSYRWDTETPVNSEGECHYVGGTVKIKWFTLKNKNDCGQDGTSEWITERRNVAEDFFKAWGFYPDSIYVSISSNSQYTASVAEAGIEWIRFVSEEAPKNNSNPSSNDIK